MEQYGWLIWVGAMIVFALAEMATVNMISVWFVAGSLAAMVVSLLGGGMKLQLIVFLIVSAGLLACLRPFVRKFVTPRKTPTNADMALGRTAYITEAVDNIRGTGALRLDGKAWTVRSTNNEQLPEGTLVRIDRLEGVKLYVSPVHTAAVR